ncbi:MAG: hypothetical protein K2X77_11880 [Candidatus Obscuribacterales bacterium]|jgi:hypothetical protein|nr:hypothetical protein [Candidatus Obscuribacterales bacterium]
MSNTLSRKTISPALQALLDRFIDYAGLFPPAKLPLDTCLTNFQSYATSDHKWMLRWFVLNETDLSNTPEAMNGLLSILTEKDQNRAATLETKSIVKAKHPVYCEVPCDILSMLDEVKANGCFAKIRTGGIKEELIPSTKDVASFIERCAQLRLAFKATAGLHHPIRAVYALTYEPNSSKATMHGFLNVLMASAFAWHGMENVEAIVAETDPAAFSFDDSAKWRDKALTISQVKDARANFIHAIGSCSFDEPVTELQALGLL